ncbi:small conductance mechanosensitive channel [Lachnospiraceae bacterium NE2001]|nr:small conductance mechanosensitive channel [Lachnospiraceae bacterium NE2001]
MRDLTVITLDDINDWIHNKGVGIFDYVIKILLALVAYIILSKILKKIIGTIEKRLDKRGVDQIASHFVLNLIKYGILTFVIITIITQLKIVEVASIAALIASAGVGISLAMQGALSNFAGGVLLLVLRPFKKGDYIVISSVNVEGVVEEIEIYYTTIRSILGETIKIPNSQLTNNSVINKQGDGKRALIVNVDIAYDSDVDKAKSIMEEIMKKDSDVVTETISVFVDELSNHGVRLGGFSMVPVDRYLAAKRAVTEQILKSYIEAGIEIPFNQLDVHLIKQ